MTSYLKKNVFSFLDDYSATKNEKQRKFDSRAGLVNFLTMNIKVYNVNGKNSDDQFNVFG